LKEQSEWEEQPESKEHTELREQTQSKIGNKRTLFTDVTVAAKKPFEKMISMY